MSRPLLALALLVALTGCGTDASGGTQRVEMAGSLTAVSAVDGGRSYVLDVAGEGLLPLDLGDLKPPLHATGVVLEVPDSVKIPDAAGERFAALDEYVQSTGESLLVVAFTG